MGGSTPLLSTKNCMHQQYKDRVKGRRVMTVGREEMLKQDVERVAEAEKTETELTESERPQ